VPTAPAPSPAEFLTAWQDARVRVSAKVDYALRAAAELAAADGDGLVKAERIAEAQDIPRKFLDNILQDLRHAGLVESRRGPEGGHRLAKPAEEITVADVFRAIDGPLAGIGGRPPEEVEYAGPAAALQTTWIALRANLRSVLERVTLAELAAGDLPADVLALTEDPDAWQRR
jgi:Rrf2 family protein